MSLQGAPSELNSVSFPREAAALLEKAGEWRALKKGMTNRSFLFTSGDTRYIIRIPGEGTDKLINRKQEADVYRAISGLGFCDDPVYLDEDSGVKITRYIEGARTCSAYDEDDVRRCMELLRRLHGMELKVGHTFDVFDRIEFYESLWGRPSVHKDYEETRERVFSLKPFIDEQKKRHCLSHIDAVCDNFLVYEGGIQLTDWEYAGMQDPHIDIAMFCVYCNYSREQVDRLIDLYFDGGCSVPERRKIYSYIAACGLLWSNWCEYKYLLGVDFGEYAQRQYQYAKDYV